MLFLIEKCVSSHPYVYFYPGTQWTNMCRSNMLTSADGDGVAGRTGRAGQPVRRPLKARVEEAAQEDQNNATNTQKDTDAHTGWQTGQNRRRSEGRASKRAKERNELHKLELKCHGDLAAVLLALRRSREERPWISVWADQSPYYVNISESEVRSRCHEAAMRTTRNTATGRRRLRPPPWPRCGPRRRLRRTSSVRPRSPRRPPLDPLRRRSLRGRRWSRRRSSCRRDLGRRCGPSMDPSSVITQGGGRQSHSLLWSLLLEMKLDSWRPIHVHSIT